MCKGTSRLQAGLILTRPELEFCLLIFLFCRLQQLHRNWHLLESFAASFCALNFIGGVRGALFLGLQAGGPAAVW
ncbi:hypothetical protein DENSPDRAFT_767687 [Dentipellis sp. KUC8613]|nr:hypothetical protein DENSPDRAFT_767687 [Dentipellis sp. KUC8613]